MTVAEWENLPAPARPRHPRHRGRVYAHCFRRSCRRFKPRPSAPCSSCGDDPVSYRGDRATFDQAHDWPYMPSYGDQRWAL